MIHSNNSMLFRFFVVGSFLVNALMINASPPDWTPLPNLLYNMNITSKLQLGDGSFSVNQHDIIAGFVGDECRGVMSPSATHGGLIFLTIGSNIAAGETITFMAYLSDENMVVELNEVIAFENLLMVGSVGDPFLFTMFLESETFNVGFIITDQQNNEVTDAIVTFDGTEYPPGHYLIDNVESGQYYYSVSKGGYHDDTGYAIIKDHDIDIDVMLYSVVADPPDWVAEPNLLYNMNITSKLLLSTGSYSVNALDMVAGFVGDKCRGVMHPVAAHGGLIFLTIGSNMPQGENIHFKAFIADQQKIVDLDQVLVFENLLLIGNPAEPFVFSYWGFENILFLSDIYIQSGVTVCFNALEHIFTAIADTEFVVHTGGNAKLIAGESIRLLPGTQVESGGFLHAYIDDVFCDNIPKAIPISPFRDVISSASMIDISENKSFFRIYPNPTDGEFVLELFKIKYENNLVVEVANVLGNHIIKNQLPAGSSEYNLSLAGHKPGLYTIKVRKGDKVGVERIIKR